MNFVLFFDLYLHKQNKENMKKFIIPYSVVCTVYVTVEAENKENAINIADSEVYLDQYVGNGGNGDKLIGVSSDNISVEAGDSFEVIYDLIREL